MSKIELKDVCFFMNDKYILKDINLKVEEGEYICIIGPSGCGKTTLIRIVSGIFQVTSGSLFVDGVDVSKKPINERGIGIVFQNYLLFTHLNARENVEYSSRILNKKIEEIEDISYKYLKMVDLLEKEKYYGYELSSGEHQKISLVRALASQTKIIVLDEPLSALDKNLKIVYRNTIKTIAKNLGLTVLHITHEQDEAMSMADKIVLMRKGEIVEIDSPKELYINSKSIFSFNFVGEANFFECVIVEKNENDVGKIMLKNGIIVEKKDCFFNIGESLVLAVRPEHIYISSSGIAAIVKEVNFMGSYWRVMAFLESGEEINFNVSTKNPKPVIDEYLFLRLNERFFKLYLKSKKGIEHDIGLE